MNQSSDFQISSADAIVFRVLGNLNRVDQGTVTEADSLNVANLVIVGRILEEFREVERRPRPDGKASEFVVDLLFELVDPRRTLRMEAI